MSIPKPKSLTITAENGRLIGVDNFGNRWLIKWCGNGQYSHWSLNMEVNGAFEERGWYLYAYPENDEQELKEQIREAEHKFKIYS